MKLETILNAYGKTQYEIGDCEASLSEAVNPDFLLKLIHERKRQVEKLKIRLMRVLKQHNGECSFSFTDAYYEDDLRHCCLECGGEMQIVRPGKWQCPKCG